MQIYVHWHNISSESSGGPTVHLIARGCQVGSQLELSLVKPVQNTKCQHCRQEAGQVFLTNTYTSTFEYRINYTWINLNDHCYCYFWLLHYGHSFLSIYTGFYAVKSTCFSHSYTTLHTILITNNTKTGLLSYTVLLNCLLLHDAIAQQLCFLVLPKDLFLFVC